MKSKLPWFGSLYWRLVLVLVVILTIVGAISLYLTVRTSRLYFQEVHQQLNHDVAKNITKDFSAFEDGRVNEKAMGDVIMKVMNINPSMEVYLLDEHGKLLSYDPSPNLNPVVPGRTVSIGPIREFLESEDSRLLLGDDPRTQDGQKVFTAAKVDRDGRPAYLYIILGGTAYEAVTGPLQESYILDAAFWIGLASLGVAAILGLASFAFLTRPLRRLRVAMAAFQDNRLDARVHDLSNDEIGQLGRIFNSLADRIVRQLQRLKETDRMRRDLIASISHDLRTPLHSMQGFLESKLIKDKELSRDEHIQYTKVALRSAQRLNGLVDDLFDLAKMDAGETQLTLESFPLPELAQDVIQKFDLKAQEKGIRLFLRVEGELPLVVADIGLIERVLDNLIENSLRYTPDGGQVAVSLMERSEGVEFRVTDTGRGIPSSALPHIFDRFYRVEKSRNDDTGGTGLGLAITKRILDLHESRIQVRSRLNVGTTFSFVLAI